MKKTILNGILLGLSFLITVWLGSLVLGALTTVTSGTPLTATTWNDMITNFFWKQNGSSVYYTGNVGIGTSNVSNGIVLQRPNSGTNDVVFQINDNIGTVKAYMGIIGTANDFVAGGSVGDFFVRGQQKLYLLGNTSGTPTITINNSGNVGIGTINPTEKLEVTGNLKVSDDIKGVKEYSFTTTNILNGWTQQYGNYSLIGDKIVCVKIWFLTNNVSYEVALNNSATLTDWPVSLNPANHGQIIGHCATSDGSGGHSYPCSLIISGGKILMTAYRPYTARSVMINSCYMKN